MVSIYSNEGFVLQVCETKMQLGGFKKAGVLVNAGWGNNLLTHQHHNLT